jgi:RNA polymerase sigma-70 factor (ECF subfamily)
MAGNHGRLLPEPPLPETYAGPGEVTMREIGEFGEFYSANYGRTVALVTALLGDRDEAQDIAQEAFARALLRWPRLRTYDLPEAWVRRVALRLATDARRRIGRVARLTRRAEMRPAIGYLDRDVAADAVVARAVLALPLRLREVIVLHYLADLPVAQIASDLRLPVSTVKTRLASGRRRLEQELSERSEVVHGDG